MSEVRTCLIQWANNSLLDICLQVRACVLLMEASCFSNHKIIFVLYSFLFIFMHFIFYGLLPANVICYKRFELTQNNHDFLLNFNIFSKFSQKHRMNMIVEELQESADSSGRKSADFQSLWLQVRVRQLLEICFNVHWPPMIIFPVKVTKLFSSSSAWKKKKQVWRQLRLLNLKHKWFFPRNWTSNLEIQSYFSYAVSYLATWVTKGLTNNECSNHGLVRHVAGIQVTRILNSQQNKPLSSPASTQTRLLRTLDDVITWHRHMVSWNNGTCKTNIWSLCRSDSTSFMNDFDTQINSSSI